jgi:hypothetical protein
MSLRNFARIVPALAVAASLVLLPATAAFGAGMSIDPDGATAPAADNQGEAGMSIDPNG